MTSCPRGCSCLDPQRQILWCVALHDCFSRSRHIPPVAHTAGSYCPFDTARSILPARYCPLDAVRLILGDSYWSLYSGHAAPPDVRSRLPGAGQTGAGQTGEITVLVSGCANRTVEIPHGKFPVGYGRCGALLKSAGARSPVAFARLAVAWRGHVYRTLFWLRILVARSGCTCWAAHSGGALWWRPAPAETSS